MECDVYTMENSCTKINIHPQALDFLFAFKGKITPLFKEVLGIHELDHIAITRINSNNQLLSLSSTPAMEFNLFHSGLWLHDTSYNPLWFSLCTNDSWQNLYNPNRYDELYYLKQTKHLFPTGRSLAAKIDNQYIIYSVASKKSCAHTQELFANQQEDFYKIGQYCSTRLAPLFNQCDALAAQPLIV